MKIGIKGILSEDEFTALQNELKIEGIEVDKFHSKSEDISDFLQLIIDDLDVIKFTRDFILSSFISLVFSTVYKKIKKVFNKNKNSISFWFILKLEKKENENLIVNFVCSENDFEKAIKKANDVINSSIFENYNTDNPLWMTYENSKLGVLITRNDNKSELIEYNDNENNFKNLPPSWKVAKISEVIKNISTNNKKLKQKEYLQVGKYPVIDQGHSFIGGYSDNDKLLLDCELPVIIFGDHTKVKKYVDFKFIVGADGVKVLRTDKRFFPKLFYYFLHCISFVDKGYARHYQHLIKEYIPIPPLAEQHLIVAKIEALFSQLDIAVASLKKAKQLIATYKQSVLKAAFSGSMQNVECRMKNEEGVMQNLECRMQNEETGLPEGWKLVKLGEICEKIENTNPNQKPDNEFIYLEIGAINNFTNKIENPKVYLGKNSPSRARQIVKKNDILFSTVRTYLKNIVLVDSIYDNQIASTGFCVLRPKITILDSKYMYYYCFHYEFLEPLNNLQRGSSYPAVRDSDIFSQFINLAPLKEQQIIVSEIEKRFSEAENLEKAIVLGLKQAESLRQSILKNAFEGKLIDNVECKM